MKDRGSSDILSCIPACNIFIESALHGNGAVLVHCFGGRSRSAAIVLAFLMSTTGRTFDDVLEELKAKRSVVQPNSGFEMQVRRRAVRGWLRLLWCLRLCLCCFLAPMCAHPTLTRWLQLRAYCAAGCDVYKAHQLLLHARLGRVGQVKRRRSVMVFRPRSRGASFERDLRSESQELQSTEIQSPVSAWCAPSPTLRHAHTLTPLFCAGFFLPQALESRNACRRCPSKTRRCRAPPSGSQPICGCLVQTPKPCKSSRS